MKQMIIPRTKILITLKLILTNNPKYNYNIKYIMVKLQNRHHHAWGKMES